MWSRVGGFSNSTVWEEELTSKTREELIYLIERANGDTSARRRDENFYETKQVMIDFMCFRLCNF